MITQKEYHVLMCVVLISILLKEIWTKKNQLN